MKEKASDNLRTFPAKTVKNRRTADENTPYYLRKFGEKCVRNLDEKWICKLLVKKPALPAWYRSIITRMLVGWAIWPQKTSLRRSLAWHELNHQIHQRTKEAPKLKTSYYTRAVDAFAKAGAEFGRVYGPLGGFYSRPHHSMMQIRDRYSRFAVDAKKCLQIVDILAYLDQNGKESNQSRAVEILSDIGAAHKLDASDPYALKEPFSENSTHSADELLGVKNYGKLFSDCQLSIEFLAALSCIDVKKTILRGKAKDKAYLKGKRLNALDAIIERSVNELPFESRKFQMELVRKAKHFSRFVSWRRTLGPESRFSDDLEELGANLSIFKGEVLAKFVDRRAGTKRMVS